MSHRHPTRFQRLVSLAFRAESEIKRIPETVSPSGSSVRQFVDEFLQLVHAGFRGHMQDRVEDATSKGVCDTVSPLVGSASSSDRSCIQREPIPARKSNQIQAPVPKGSTLRPGPAFGADGGEEDGPPQVAEDLEV